MVYDARNHGCGSSPFFRKPLKTSWVSWLFASIVLAESRSVEVNPEVWCGEGKNDS
jgi:hypothetical protein